ncbi:MAG: PD40 domain-containing protein [Alphaproteobacteria bacterium]|nr:PD40 domain-containing protein [Alphaproteobacteria bacterium]
MSGKPAMGSEAELRPTPIPEDAEFIFASARSRELTSFGLRSVELYAATRAGEVTRITHSRHAHNHFVVSPDRTKIACNRYREDTNKDGRLFALDDWKDLWIVDLVGRTERSLLPEMDAGYGGIAWLPDSRHIVFATPTARGRDIVKVDTQTGKYVTLTEGLDDLLKNPCRRNLSDVDVSPDGQWIVFGYKSNLGEAVEPKSRIAAMRLDGSEARILTDGGPLERVKRGDWYNGDYDPDFSPDGRQVVFARQTDRGMANRGLSTMDLMTVGLDGTGLARITRPPDDAAHGIASWDRRGIVFTEWSEARGNTTNIYDPATKEIVRVPIPGSTSHVQWIPQAGPRAS